MIERFDSEYAIDGIWYHWRRWDSLRWLWRAAEFVCRSESEYQGFPGEMM